MDILEQDAGISLVSLKVFGKLIKANIIKKVLQI